MVEKNLDRAEKSEDIKFLLLILFTTASNNTLRNVFEEVNKKVCQLNEQEINDLAVAINGLPAITGGRKEDYMNGHKEYSPRLSALIIESVNDYNVKARIFNDVLIDYEGREQGVLRACRKPAAYLVTNGEHDDRMLNLISRSYQEGVYDSAVIPLRHRQRGGMCLESATVISESVSKYPTRIVELADRVLRKHLDNESDPVREIADRDNWFSSQI